MVEENSITNRRYTYVRECKWPVEAIDIHHVVVRTSRAKRFVGYVALVTGLSNLLFLLLWKKNESVTILFWSFILTAFFFKLFIWKPVKKESVIIMPALGVQLETIYMSKVKDWITRGYYLILWFNNSGKVIRRFLPIGKILRPVLLERVTPVTCYWSLSFVVRDEGELMLVFKELHPPAKMLVPIWKALCATIDCKGSPDTEDG